jgi:hypothetical protein
MKYVVPNNSLAIKLKNSRCGILKGASKYIDAEASVDDSESEYSELEEAKGVSTPRDHGCIAHFEDLQMTSTRPKHLRH